VIVSDFPDMGALVDQFGCGWKTQVDEHAVASLVYGLTGADIRAKRAAALAWAEDHVWERQEPVHLRVYENLRHRSGLVFRQRAEALEGVAAASRVTGGPSAIKPKVGAASEQTEGGTQA
jgi:hypothetical protein